MSCSASLRRRAEGYHVLVRVSRLVNCALGVDAGTELEGGFEMLHFWYSVVPSTDGNSRVVVLRTQTDGPKWTSTSCKTYTLCCSENHTRTLLKHP